MAAHNHAWLSSGVSEPWWPTCDGVTALKRFGSRRTSPSRSARTSRCLAQAADWVGLVWSNQRASLPRVIMQTTAAADAFGVRVAVEALRSWMLAQAADVALLLLAHRVDRIKG